MKATQIHRLKPLLVIVILFSFITSCHAAGTMRGIHLDRIQLSPGFNIRLYAAEVPNARSLTMSSKGVIFVGSREKAEGGN
jgi:hypothetical protein